MCRLIVLFVLVALGSARAEESCECAQTSCKPCEIETGTSFYSAKCGPGDSKVKSCKRPTCTPVENQNKCLALLKNPSAGQALAPEDPVENKSPKQVGIEAGQILDLAGEVEVSHASGVTEKPRKREAAYVGDVFETRAEGRLKVLLKDGSEMTLGPSSKLRIEKADVDPGAMKRQIALQILAGKVRNRVQKDYKDPNFFQVRTKSAVAGVRGTDFITSYALNEEGQWVSEVRTIEGLVRLRSPSARGPTQFIDIPPGTFAHLTSLEDGKSEGPGSFQLSPLFRIKTDDLNQLQREDFLASNAAVSKRQREPASTSSLPICDEPAGAYHQCSYTCKNNPRGEKRCRTDLENVQCVRKLCQANGRWEDERAVRTDEGDRCRASGPVVGSCDGYW